MSLFIDTFALIHQLSEERQAIWRMSTWKRKSHISRLKEINRRLPELWHEYRKEVAQSHKPYRLLETDPEIEAALMRTEEMSAGTQVRVGDRWQTVQDDEMVTGLRLYSFDIPLDDPDEKRPEPLKEYLRNRGKTLEFASTRSGYTYSRAVPL